MSKQTQRGFSLVEVMVATGISVGMFLFLNQSLLTLKKTQIKMERRSELVQIFNFIEQHLGDLRAWQDNPEGEPPKKANSTNFYYYPHRKAEITQLSLTEEEFNNVTKNYKCPTESPRCRVILFTYQGELISPLNLKSLPNSYIIASLGMVTPDEEISRLYLPEIKLHITDTEDDSELRLPDKVRTLNTLQTQASRSEQTIDPVMRAKCFNLIIDKYPENYTMASDLCSKISSTMPAQCYITMRSEYNASDIVSQVVCTKALSPRPLECFRQGKERLGVDEALIAIACSGASSFAPLDCLELVKEKSESLMESTLPYKICARAQDTSPAECLITLIEKRSQSMDQALGLCPHHK